MAVALVKVLLLSHSSGVENLGGAELTLVHMIDEWRRHRTDIEFFVVARGGEAGRLQPMLDNRGVQHELVNFDAWVLPVPYTSPHHLLDITELNSVATLRLVEIMREWQPDVVITNTIVSPWAALAAKHVDVPHVWMVHEYGDLDHRLQFQYGRDQTFEDIGLLSDVVVANSVAVRDHVAAWIPHELLTIAYPPIDLNRAREKAGVPGAVLPPAMGVDSALNVVVVGRIATSKGQWRLVEAISRLRDRGVDVCVTCVGDASGAEADELRSLIAQRGVGDRVQLVGEQTNPFAFVAAADLGVVTSDSEAFGRVTAEYMALGKPVVAARSGASPELITEGESGWFFDVNDVEELTAVLGEAAADAGERARRGTVAAAAIEGGLLDRFTLADAIVRVEGVITSGSRPMARLPGVARAWLTLPPSVDTVSQRAHGDFNAVRASRTWRLGRLLLAPARMAKRVLRR
jgi:glycosyltransferase involved in cell wall biosynthesis